MFLALLGGLAARAGGAGVAIGAIPVTFWAALAMGLTAGIGWLFGTVVQAGQSDACAVMCLPRPPGGVPRRSWCNGKSQKLSIGGWLPSDPRILQ
jgi:hypothetical protein